jgi:hypothetical protein
MKTIKVPEVEKEAYNPDRPISGLIQMQLVHLSAAERGLPPRQRTGTNIAMLHTEAQAAEYIGRVTALLHRAGKAARNKASKKKQPSKPRKAATKKTKKSGKKRTSSRSRK